MEKINKKELMKKLNLTEEDLEKVAGGHEDSTCSACLDNYIKSANAGLEFPLSNCYAACK